MNSKDSNLLLNNFLSFLPPFYLIHLEFLVISEYFIATIAMNKSLLTFNEIMKKKYIRKNPRDICCQLLSKCLV